MYVESLNTKRHDFLKVHGIHILPHYVNCATRIMHLTYHCKKKRVNKIPRCPHTNFSKIVKLQNSSHFLTKIRFQPTTVTQHISKLTQTPVYYISVWVSVESYKRIAVHYSTSFYLDFIKTLASMCIGHGRNYPL